MKSSTTDLVLTPDAAIDLQVHTTFSDGKWLPEELIDHLVNEGFALAAITDHDRADTVDVLQKLAVEKNLPILIAVEMTCMWKGDITDILCYGFDPDKPALPDLAKDVTRRQSENTRMVYDNLTRKGLNLPADELEIILQKPAAQQPHELVPYLKRHGYGTGEVSAGKMVMEAGFAFAFNEVPAVVDAAHQSGAVAIIAHPGRDDGFVTFDVNLLDELRDLAPFDGVEAYYPKHTPEQTAMYLDYAQKHDLLVSSGSDSHDSSKLPIKYKAELSRKLLERVGIQVK